MTIFYKYDLGLYGVAFILLLFYIFLKHIFTFLLT